MAVTFDDRDSNITYPSTASQATQEGPYNGTLTFSSLTGIFAQFNFTGENVALIGQNGPYTDRSSSIDVYIDGVLKANFSQVTGGTVNQAVNASITGLSTGEHYLQIKNNQANYYVFDAVKVDDGCELRPYSASPTSSSTRRRVTL